jgi:hypothetical protein
MFAFSGKGETDKFALMYDMIELHIKANLFNPHYALE